MAYSDFTVKKVKDELHLQIVETKSLFADVPEIAIISISRFWCNN